MKRVSSSHEYLIQHLILINMNLTRFDDFINFDEFLFHLNVQLYIESECNVDLFIIEICFRLSENVQY